MLELSGVTLCCVDTANPELALRALRCSVSGIHFARTLFLTDRVYDVPGIDIRVVEALKSREAYSAFVLKTLVEHIDTAHVLLIQWDGYVVNPAAWRDEFLACDYLGAKWFWHKKPRQPLHDPMRVGNGGFSLRSRKLLVALQDSRVELAGPEDETICRVFRPLLEREHGIVFGSEGLADAFAFEAAYPIGLPFGFHGLFNFCRVVPPGEIAELTRLFTPAIARSPQLLQLARNCMALAQWGAAAAIFRRILDVDPAHAEAAAALATASINAATAPAVGRNDPCPCGSGKRYKHCHGASGSSAAPAPAVVREERMKQALALHQRGASGDMAAAEATYRDVLAREPDNALAQHFLGVIHYQRGEIGTALPLLERAVAAQPGETEFHNNLGLALAAADRETDAIGAYRAALSLEPDHAVAWNNLGLALQAQNEIRAAIDAFRHALALEPEFAQVRWNLALALLLDGQFAEGWSEYDARLALLELGRDRHRFPGPLWDGAAPSGKTLLVYPEQGLGDAVHFARYATLLADAGARCVIRCPETIAPLLATIPGVAGVSRDGEALPRYDAHLPLLSLPGVLGTTAQTIPTAVPYVAISDAKRAAARAALARTGATRAVGLCWAGNAAHGNDRNRSLPLAALAPLLAVPGISWFSLQQGKAAAQIATTPAAEHIAPLPADSALVDTAALIAELDLVITVDTSIAHLAGALARPAWLLLPFAPDWRWQLGRDDSPWYPTLRLFRQPRPRDWQSVVARVQARLETGKLEP
ncbi:MAG: tetratricopeptide repeat protein [Pseudomonadota bacterium]|nr:tetratricopeptide repeat protein [Pseudomonadota bacterium]